MNRFVMILREAYDEYEAAVPHPVETAVGREELLAVLRGWAADLDALWQQTENYLEDGDAAAEVGRRVLADTGLCLVAHAYTRLVPHSTSDDPHGWRVEFRPPDILTVDAWFDRHFRALVARLVSQTQRRLDLERFRDRVTDETFIVIYVNSRDTEDTVRNLRRFADVRATPRQVRELARYVRLHGLPLRHLA